MCLYAWCDSHTWLYIRYALAAPNNHARRLMPNDAVAFKDKRSYPAGLPEMNI